MRYIRRLRKLTQTGVTFVELLIVMGLLSVFLMILATIFAKTIDVQSQTEGYSAVLSDGRYIMARLDYDIARASGASAITSPATLGASSSSLIMSISGATYTYQVSGNALQLTDGTGTANLTDDNIVISAVSFLKLGNASGKHTIRYTFTLTSTGTHGSGKDSQTFTGTAERRS